MTNKDIKEFQQIYLEETGKEISKQDAIKYGTYLINLYKSIYKPLINKDQYEEKYPYLHKK